MATQAKQLAKFAEALKFDDIPAEVISRVKLHLLDTLSLHSWRRADFEPLPQCWKDALDCMPPTVGSAAFDARV
jgi:hypothetical protein